MPCYKSRPLTPPRTSSGVQHSLPQGPTSPSGKCCLKSGHWIKKPELGELAYERCFCFRPPSFCEVLSYEILDIFLFPMMKLKHTPVLGYTHTHTWYFPLYLVPSGHREALFSVLTATRRQAQLLWVIHKHSLKKNLLLILCVCTYPSVDVCT